MEARSGYTTAVFDLSQENPHITLLHIDVNQKDKDKDKWIELDLKSQTYKVSSLSIGDHKLVKQNHQFDLSASYTTAPKSALTAVQETYADIRRFDSPITPGDKVEYIVRCSIDNAHSDQSNDASTIHVPARLVRHVYDYIGVSSGVRVREDNSEVWTLGLAALLNSKITFDLKTANMIFHHSKINIDKKKIGSVDKKDTEAHSALK